jgi:hypothetical protein
MTGEEKAEGIRMGDFFNKLTGRASGWIKAQARPTEAFDDLR